MRAVQARAVCLVLACLLAAAAAVPTRGPGGPGSRGGMHHPQGGRGGMGGPPQHRQRGPGGPGADLREACQADVEELCGDALEDGPGAVFHCLAAHVAEVSDGCKTAISGALHHAGGDEGDHEGPHRRHDGPEDGPDGPDGPRHRGGKKSHHRGGKKSHHRGGKKSHHRGGKKNLRRACKADAKSLCADAISAGPMAVLKCLNKHEAALSATCKAALSSLPKPPAAVVKVMDACSKQVESVCPPPPPPAGGPARRLRGEHGGKKHGGQKHGGKKHGGPHGGPPGPFGAVKCLVDNVDKLTGSCAAAVKALAADKPSGPHFVPADGGDAAPAEMSAGFAMDPQDNKDAVDADADADTDKVEDLFEGVDIVAIAEAVDEVDEEDEEGLLMDMAPPAEEEEEEGDEYDEGGDDDEYDEDDEDDEDMDAAFKSSRGRGGKGHGRKHFPWHIVAIAGGAVVLVAAVVATVVIVRRRRARRAAANQGFTQLATIEPLSTKATVQGTPVGFA